MKDLFDNLAKLIEDGLKVNFKAVILQLAATIILFLIIRFFLWKPITEFIQKQEDAHNKELEEAKQSNIDAAKMKEEIASEFESSRMEAKKMRDVLEKEALDEKQRIISDAKDEAKRRLEQAELSIKQEEISSRKEIEQSIKEVAFYAAEKIIKAEIDKKKHEELVDEIIKEKANEDS